MYNGTTTDFEVKSWWHTTLWMALCHREYGVACVCFYAKKPCSNLRWSITRSFLLSTWGCAPWWALIWVNSAPIQDIGPKVEGGRSFVSGRSSMRLQYMFLYCCSCSPRPALKGFQSRVEESIRITFHVLVPLPLWAWDSSSNSCMHIRFGQKDLGNWKENCGSMTQKYVARLPNFIRFVKI